MKRSDKIETFMNMLMKEARRISLVNLCESWGISESELDECMKYLKEKLELERL